MRARLCHRALRLAGFARGELRPSSKEKLEIETGIGATDFLAARGSGGLTEEYGTRSLWMPLGEFEAKA